jgi:hypothetical protein
MYNTNEEIFNIVSDSRKRYFQIRLMILLALSILGGYLLSLLNSIDGADLGQLIFPLFLLSVFPILVNFFYLVMVQFKLRNNLIMRFFAFYYTPSLIIHSVLFTLALGVVIAHSLLVWQQSIYCLIFLISIGVLWLMEYALWMKNWPLYVKADEQYPILHWLHWSVLFGLLVGIPFHAKTSNLFWMIGVPSLLFGSLMILIFQNVLTKVLQTKKLGKGRSKTSLIKG